MPFLYPDAGAQFLTQYASGLKGQIPLYAALMIDAVAAENRELALNAINEKFVSGFRAAYKRDGQPKTSVRLTVGGLCRPASHSRRPNPPDANRKTIPDRHRTKRKAARQHPIRVQPSRPATSLVLDW
jgi:hypothetical protein